MKVFEQIEVPAKTEQRHTQTLCDRCKKDVEPSDFYGVDDVDVKCRTGVHFPDGGGGHGSEYEIDLCAPCFTDWLVPLLRQQGIEVREREWDY